MSISSYYFELEKMKEFKETGVDQKKVVKKLPYQIGKSSKYYDERRGAIAPGKRISRTGKTYWETRKNRSDMTGSNT
jgi:hypothetical protein